MDDEKATFTHRAWGYYCSQCWCGREFKAFGGDVEQVIAAEMDHIATCPVVRQRLTARSQ